MLMLTFFKKNTVAWTFLRIRQMVCAWAVLCVGGGIQAQTNDVIAPGRADAIQSLTATGHDRRIDLHWLPVATGKERFTVERAEQQEGPFITIAEAHRSNTFSDFIGENDRTYSYRVTRMSAVGKAGVKSGAVLAGLVEKPGRIEMVASVAVAPSGSLPPGLVTV